VVRERRQVEAPGKDRFFGEQGEFEFGLDPIGRGGGRGPAEDEKPCVFDGAAQLGGPRVAGLQAYGVEEQVQVEWGTVVLELIDGDQVLAGVTDEGVVHWTRLCSE